MKILMFAVISYLVGSIPTALIIGLKYFKTDIRHHGSKNLGGTNAGRVLGKTAGLIISILDIAKVFLPAFISKYYLGIGGAAIVGTAGMLGHCYPVFAQFKGGKAVSSFFGMVLAMNFTIAGIMVVIWNILKFATNYVSVASMATGLASVALFYVAYGFSLQTYILFAAAMFVIFKHRANISRLIKGTENKVRKS